MNSRRRLIYNQEGVTYMNSNRRLLVTMLSLICSAFYAVLVTENADLASAIAAGYVAIVLTFFVLCMIGKKKE